MGFLTVPDKSTGDIVSAAMWNDYVAGNINTGIPVLLADSTLSVAAASIDFTSIAQDWAHLMIVAYLRGDTAAVSVDVVVRLNGDETSSYDRQIITGRASSALAGESFAGAWGQVGSAPAASGGANLFSAITIDIPHYAQSTNNKMVRSDYAMKYGTSTGNLDIGSSTVGWRNSAAVTQVTLLPGAGNFVAGSRASLYGMPG